MKMNNSLNDNILVYYFSIVLLTLSLSLPHAVLTVLLLDKGLTLSQILMIQTSFSIAILIFEYPSGILADFLSRKAIFLIGKSLLILTFLSIIYFNNFWIIFIGWFLYGVSTALTDGSLDAELINDIKINDQDKLNKFVSRSHQLTFISLIVGSSLGSILYSKMDVYFYFISIFFVVMTLLFVQLFFKNLGASSQIQHKIDFKLIKNQIIHGFQEINNSIYIKLIIILTILSQFFFQTHFQLWQAFLLNRSINPEHFFIFYIIFQLIGMFVYNISLDNIKLKISKLLIITISLVATTLPILIVFGNTFLSILIYMIFVSLFTFIGYLCTYIFSKQVSKERISSLTSFKATCARIGAILSLLFGSLLLRFFGVEYVIIINFIISIVSSLIVIFVFLKVNSSKNRH
ncbi:MAG: MFS transporter [Defluviitaleaceae bacterium]|nr:MFS transporter [Defluviitaleaceae bacterium]